MSTRIAPQDATWPPLLQHCLLPRSLQRKYASDVQPPAPPVCFGPLSAICIRYPAHLPRLQRSCMHMQSAGHYQRLDGSFLQVTGSIRDLMHASAQPTTSRDGRIFGSKDGAACGWVLGVPPMQRPGHIHGLVMRAAPNWKSSSCGDSSEL